MHLICQTKSPMLTDKWLKGFQNILNYAGDIGCQSCVTNFGTPCTKIRSISQWFPEKRGLVGSIVIAGSGYGPTVWIPLQTLYVNPDNVAAVEAEGEIDRYASFRLS